MRRRTLTALVFAALVAPPLAATDTPKALWERTVAAYPAPKLQDVGGREYKFLVDPAKAGATPEEAFAAVWSQVKAAAEKKGFTVTEKEKNPLKIELSTKEYFDTKDQALFRKGYIVRVTQKYKDGKADPSVAVTVKSVVEDAVAALAVPLKVVGGTKAKTEAEENVGIGPDGELRGYVEKGSTVTVGIDELGKMTLGEFGKFVPELLSLGLPADTKLVGNKAWSYRVRPGAIVLPGTEPCGVSMEGWAKKEGGAPHLYDFSWGYSDLDFYEAGPTHAAGEQFLLQVMHGELASLAMPESGKWGGSKVRKLMNRPITR